MPRDFFACSPSSETPSLSCCSNFNSEEDIYIYIYIWLISIVEAKNNKEMDVVWKLNSPLSQTNLNSASLLCLSQHCSGLRGKAATAVPHAEGIP